MKKIFLLPVFILVCYGSIAQDAMVNPYLYSNFPESTYDSLIRLINNFIPTQDSAYLIREGKSVPNPWWLLSDIKRYGTPFFYFHGVRNLPNDAGGAEYKPVILSISKEMEYDDYLARIAYVGRWDSVNSYVNQINMVAITKDSRGDYKLRNPMDLLTKYWPEKKVGRVTYKINHSRQFDRTEAVRMDSFNTAIAAYFHVPPCEFTYYSCKTYQEMWKAMGVEYGQVMYINDNSTGGFSLHYAKCIISGNNSEYYPHELVHIYSNIIYSSEDYRKGYKYNRMADEGMATYFGGSQELSLEHHLSKLKEYIERKKIEKLESIIDIKSARPGHEIVKHTDVYYAVGGMIAYLVDKKAGYEGLIEMLTNTNQATMLAYVGELYDIPEKEVKPFILRKIKQFNGF